MSEIPPERPVTNEAFIVHHWQLGQALAPYARENHPTDEHLLPLFVALGAAGANIQGIYLHRSYTLTLADWCLFTTLFRFDLAYYGLFKCNLRRLVDFPHLWNYCRHLYQHPGVRESYAQPEAIGL